MMECIKILAIVILGQLIGLLIYVNIESWVEERRARKFAESLRKQRERDKISELKC